MRGLLLFLAFTCACFSQRLYDRTRDERAQEALKAAKQIGSGDLFKAQQANLDLIEARDLEAYLLQAREAMRSQVLAFQTWADIDAFVDQVDGQLAQPGDSIISARKDKLNALSQQAKDAGAALKHAAPPDAQDDLEDARADVGDLASIFGKAEKILDFKSAEAEKAIAVAQRLGQLYTSYADRMKEMDSTIAKLESLKSQVARAAFERLKVQIAYLGKQMDILLRQEEDNQKLRDLIADYRGQREKFAAPPDPLVTQTLEKLRTNEPALEAAIQALYDATALAARRNIASGQSLVDLRLAQAQHLYSVRLSAVNAKVYESVLLAGATRLALFYEGGVKATTIAELVHSIATVAIPAVIAAK